MITASREDLQVHRHAAFPSVDPFVLVDETTGVPIDLTGATITIQVRLYEGAAGDPMLTAALPVVDGPRGKYGPPGFTETDHETLVEASVASLRDRRSEVKLAYDIKFEGVTGFPSSFIGLFGDYTVRTGVNV